jgi:hypothetical protein
MAGEDVKLQVTNLAQWRRAITSVDDNFKTRLKDEFLKVAEAVATKARSKVPTGPTGRAAASIKARASTGGAAIVRGGSAAPYFAWLDFGGTTGRGHKLGKGKGAIQRTVNGAPWSPPNHGLYIYPTISEMRPETIHAVSELMTRVGRDAGFETHGSMDVEVAG